MSDVRFSFDDIINNRSLFTWNESFKEIRCVYETELFALLRLFEWMPFITMYNLGSIYGAHIVFGTQNHLCFMNKISYFLCIQKWYHNFCICDNSDADCNAIWKCYSFNFSSKATFNTIAFATVQYKPVSQIKYLLYILLHKKKFKLVNFLFVSSLKNSKFYFWIRKRLKSIVMS